MMKMGMRPVALPWDNVTFEPSPEAVCACATRRRLARIPTV